MSSPSVPPKTVLSWAFDVAVMVTGAVLGLLAIVDLAFGGHLDLQWVLALLLGVPVIAIMNRYPLVLNRSFQGIEVCFDAAVLVFLACFDGGVGALAVWAVGQVVSQLARHKRIDVRLFNVGLGILSGWAALLGMRVVNHTGDTSVRELLAVAFGCAVFFVVDYVLSAVSIALEDGSPLSVALRQSSGVDALGVFVAVDSLGYLAAIVVRALPDWALGLLAVPLMTILVASRAVSLGNEHRRRLQALFEAAADAQVVRSAEELELLLRKRAKEAVGQTRADLRPHGPSKGEVGALIRAGSRELWLIAPAVERARASMTADRRALEALATVGEEAFSRLSLTEELGRLARHDALTGLPNQTLFLDRVEQAVARSRRKGTLLAVLFLDLDGFKAVNDRFGHAQGDELLQVVAERLSANVREVDVVARLGGDEFAVLAEDVEGTLELHQLCERLLAALRRQLVVAGHEVVVGASIGVAVAGPDDDGPALLRNADLAMYRAKALGKDRFSIYQPSLLAENVDRLGLIEALRAGLETELVVHYQPLVNLTDGSVVAMEALVRWQHDDVLVQPSAFISAAEESGLISMIGAQVLAQVVADAPLLSAAAGRTLDFCCNMSPQQLRDPSFVPHVQRAVAALGQERIVLEMTELVAVHESAETAAVLASLRTAGAKLAVSDFGVGFSSIGHLRHLPVGILKIDRAFIRDIDTNPRAAAVVKALLVMGEALGLDVVAQGVERPEQAACLRRAGFTIGQGHFFGRAAPVGELLAELGTGVTDPTAWTVTSPA